VCVCESVFTFVVYLFFLLALANKAR
jgi:hypothetical protein